MGATLSPWYDTKIPPQKERLVLAVSSPGFTNGDHVEGVVALYRVTMYHTSTILDGGVNFHSGLTE